MAGGRELDRSIGNSTAKSIDESIDKPPVAGAKLEYEFPQVSCRPIFIDGSFRY